MLAIQRTLQFEPAAGIATGMGAAVADALYGAIGAFGITVLIRWLVEHKAAFALVGSLVLLWMAWRIARQPPAAPRAPAAIAQRLPSLFAGTFVLTLSNPTTILSFIAVFGAIAGRTAVASPWVMIAGVFAGSALWWLLLAAAVGRLRAFRRTLAAPREPGLRGAAGRLRAVATDASAAGMTQLRCHLITVEAPVARAFMYFTPAGESHWVEGWKPTYLHPSDGRTEPGMVFTTGEGAEHTVWMLADFDRGAHRSRYLRCTPGSRLVVVEIACRALDAQTTGVEVAYTLTALTPAAEPRSPPSAPATGR